jgi:hypothetical protein
MSNITSREQEHLGNFLMGLVRNLLGKFLQRKNGKLRCRGGANNVFCGGPLPCDRCGRVAEPGTD